MNSLIEENIYKKKKSFVCKNYNCTHAYNLKNPQKTWCK
jgi:hypothetical protein